MKLLKYAAEEVVKAANEIYDNFKVSSIQVVSRVKGVRDKQRQEVPDKLKKNSFADILREAETAKAAEKSSESVCCDTTTYGTDRRLLEFHYKTREYTY